MTERAIRCLSVLVLVSAIASLAQAADSPTLWSSPIPKVRIDGMLREWQTRMTPLDVRIRGKVRDEPTAEGALGYDENNLYVSLDVVDDKLIRTGGAGASEDHATLFLAFPATGASFVRYRVDLYPGVPGKSAALVKLDGRKLGGAKIVEAPTDAGFTLEASLPWSSFPASSKVRTGLRGVLEYTDADRAGVVKAVIATAESRNAKAMPPVMMESEQGLYANLLRPNGLSTLAAKAVTGDVAGDGMLEQVAVYGQFLTIVGGHYRDGREFYYSDLLVAGPSAVVRLELKDFDGDGKSEILTVRRIGSKTQYREVLQILKLSDSGEPSSVLTHEVGVKSSTGSVENTVTVSRDGGKWSVVIKAGKNSQADEALYNAPRPSDMPSALLPWDEVTSRTYQWVGSAFEESATTTQKVASKRTGNSGSAPSVSGPPPPRPPSSDELMDQVYALYRKDRKVGKHSPRFDFMVNVAADQTPERVLVHGKDIVVFGKGFLNGSSYTYITMGVQEPEHVIDVTAKDMTGDGVAEIIVRLVMHSKASEELGGDIVKRDAFVVYKVKQQKIARIFAAETGRQLDDDRVLGGIAFVPGQIAGLAIELRPGRALGWTQTSYPFPEDHGPSAGLEPFVLPWRSDIYRYQYDGDNYVK